MVKQGKDKLLQMSSMLLDLSGLGSCYLIGKAMSQLYVMQQP